jgi:hypothetical protein
VGAARVCELRNRDTSVAVQKTASFRRLHVALKREKCPFHAGFSRFRRSATGLSRLVAVCVILLLFSTVRVYWELLDAT